MPDEVRKIYEAINKVDQASVDRHNHLVEHINKLHAQQGNGMRNERVEVVKELVTHIYGKATAYTNLIIIAGYVAFYTMWGSVKNDLPTTWMLLAGLLITFSLIMFVSFEIYKMILTGVHHKKVNAVLQEDGTDGAIIKVKRLEQEFETRMYKFWLWILVPTVGSGVGAGVILIISFGQQLLAELAS